MRKVTSMVDMEKRVAVMSRNKEFKGNVRIVAATCGIHRKFDE
jgi:hypothetical protein